VAAKKQAAQHDSNVAVNRRARYEYEILQQWEAGIALLGSEIKSIRLGQANIAEGYARLMDGELWLYNVHIAPYLPARVNHEPRRTRRLLLHRRQLDDLEKLLREQPRTTVIPLRMYLKDGLVKVEVGVGRGRRAYDKRQAIAAREAGRTMQRALRHSAR
jgi:SsrA-binding protein